MGFKIWKLLSIFICVFSITVQDSAQAQAVRKQKKISFQENYEKGNQSVKDARNCKFEGKSAREKKSIKAIRDKLGIKCGSDNGSTSTGSTPVVCEAPRSLVNGECKCSDNLVWNANAKSCEKAPSAVECSGLNISKNAEGTGCRCTSSEYSLIQISSVPVVKFQCIKLINPVDPINPKTPTCRGDNIKPFKASCICTSSAYILKEVEEKVFECIARANDSDPKPAPSYCQSTSGYSWDGVAEICSCQEGFKKMPYPVAPGSTPPAPGFACAKPIVESTPSCSIVNSSYNANNKRCECNGGFYAKPSGKPVLNAEPIEAVSVESAQQLRVAAPTTIESIKEPITKPLLIGELESPNLLPRWVAGPFTCEKVQIIKPAPIPTCNDPKVYDATRKDCVCKPGYYAEAIGAVSIKPVAIEEVKITESTQTLAARTALAAPEEISIKPAVGVVDSIKRPNYIEGKSFTCKLIPIIKPAPVFEPIPVKPVIKPTLLEPIKPAPVTEPITTTTTIKPSFKPNLQLQPSLEPVINVAPVKEIDTKIIQGDN